MNDPQVIQMVLIILYISLLTLFIGFSINNKSLNKYFNEQSITTHNIDSIRLVSLIIFLISFTVRILYWIDAIKILIQLDIMRISQILNHLYLYGQWRLVE